MVHGTDAWGTNRTSSGQIGYMQVQDQGAYNLGGHRLPDRAILQGASQWGYHQGQGLPTRASAPPVHPHNNLDHAHKRKFSELSVPPPAWHAPPHHQGGPNPMGRGPAPPHLPAAQPYSMYEASQATRPRPMQGAGMANANRTPQSAYASMAQPRISQPTQPPPTTPIDNEALFQASRQLGRKSSPCGPAYTRLTKNITEMVETLTPTAGDTLMRQQVLELVGSAALKAFPEYPNLKRPNRGRRKKTPRASPQANTSMQPRTQTPNSKTHTGGINSDRTQTTTTSIRSPKTGFYEKNERPAIARMLDRLTSQLRQVAQSLGGIRTLIVIRSARVPIIRLSTREGLVLDLSISGAGPHTAATYIRDRLVQYPALRPLVIVLKAYLKPYQLNDVSVGGLASYGLTYMMLAHLQMEEAAGSDTKDLGLMLIQFCKRFGPDYDPYSVVVSVTAGGVVSRQRHSPAESNSYQNPDRICVVDPNTGRDCTEGCYQSEAVLQAFADAHEKLSELVGRYKNSCPAGIELLEEMMNYGGSHGNFY
eukprot:gene27030-2257_t